MYSLFRIKVEFEQSQPFSKQEFCKENHTKFKNSEKTVSCGYYGSLCKPVLWEEQKRIE